MLQGGKHGKGFQSLGIPFRIHSSHTFGSHESGPRGGLVGAIGAGLSVGRSFFIAVAYYVPHRAHADAGNRDGGTITRRSRIRLDKLPERCPSFDKGVHLMS